MGEEMQYNKTHIFEWQKDKIQELLIEVEVSRNANMYLRECHSDWSTKAIEWKEKSELLQLEIYELESKLALQNILMFDIPEWISIDDRLPEVGVPVLIHAPQLEVGFIVGMIDSDYVDGMWVFPDEDDSMKFKYGKFWQPLPKPPTKELNK